jgi:hypothetical protein
MANWKTQIAQLGMGAMVAGLEAVRGSVSKGEYKRVLATAVAQLLALHPDLGLRQARRRARKVTGAKPAKKAIAKPGRNALRKTAEATAVAAAGAGALKVVGALGNRVATKLEDAVESRRWESRTGSDGDEQPRHGDAPSVAHRDADSQT